MFTSEFCNVEYLKKHNIVFVKWKKFCCYENYRKPLEYALETIKKYKCNYVADTRNGFENINDDTEWVANYFMPMAAKYGCKCIYFIIDKNNNYLESELKGQENNSNNILEFKYILSFDEI